MSFEYDLFISYSSADREWAEKLSDDLSAKQIRVFFDQKRLQPGALWEDALLNALARSRHLVVLWSQHAQASQWVTREFAYFDAQINSRAQGETADSRRLIFLLLDGEPRAYSSYQMITDLRDAGAYRAGIRSLNAQLWLRVVSKIEGVIRIHDPRKPILLAVLTMTAARLSQINPAAAPPFGQDLNTLLSHIGVESMQNLAQSYGTTHTAWRPFGSLVDVTVILDRLLEDINSRSRGDQFRWELISDEFWSNDIDVVDRQIQRLASNPSVVVIDPIALYDTEVRSRLERMDACFANPKALIMLLAPYKLPGQVHSLRQLIKVMAKRAFDRFYEFPEHMGRVQAYCSVHVSDDLDARRWLLMVLGPYLSGAQRQTAEYLSLGGDGG